METFIMDIIKYGVYRNIEYMRTKYNLPISADKEEDTFSVLNIYILEWIKFNEIGYLYISKGIPKDFKPLKINADYPWCQLLIRLIEEKTIYSKYFCISNGLFDYKPEIMLAEKKRLRNLAIENNITFTIID